MWKTPICSFFLCLSLLLPNSTVSSEIDTQYSENIERAVNWLKDGYNSTIGLIREDHIGSSNSDRVNNYWLFSDNFLAYLVLTKYDKALADAILQKIHSYDYYQNYKHSAYAFGYKIRMPPYGALQTSGYPVGWFLEANITGSEIWVETYINATTKISDYDRYVDWLFPKALTYYWLGKDAKAREVYDKAISDYWNGIGFTDVIEYNAYTTYKIGAALYTGLVLYPYNWQNPKDLVSYFTYWKNLIWKLQRADGGIPTHYHANGSTKGHNPNTETICFSLLYTLVQHIIQTVEIPYAHYTFFTGVAITLALVLRYWKVYY